MLYAMNCSPAPPFLVRDHPRSNYSSFSDHLRAFISSRLDGINPYAESAEYCRQQEIVSRPSRRNDEFAMLNVELTPAEAIPDSSFLARDRSDSYHAPSRGNVEFSMLNVESNPAVDPFRVCDRSDSYHAFVEDLREFISLRLDRVDPYRESKEYGLQQEKASCLYERLLAMLPEEGKALLLQYADALETAHYLEVAILSERAFLDGVRVVIRAMLNDEC